MITGCLVGGPEEAANDSDTSRPVGKVVFEFGQEDWSDREFGSFGFSGHSEYTCRVGVNCSTEAFPQRLHRAQTSEYAKRYADAGVERIIIKFKLKQTYNKVVLRLVRGGDETTVVTIDEKRTHLVTNTMLGSNDGYLVGVHNLILGALKNGEHTIELTVADDGKDNGTS